MPKLSKSRIINLNYNDGKRTIYDEIFDYGEGKDTLFSMENGIGKTVLIQFFLQPFIRNKRELAGRRFEEYFTGTSPTYILHEVLLENNEKLLLGMIIKKDSSEDDKNKLRILTFLNRYSKPNDFDLINAPFVEGRRILKFSEAEDKVKKYKSGKLNFKYYNFNDSSKKSEYFEDLKAYKINYKEWEDIIRAINNDESGLSNLYDKHKTDEALVRNVIVPLIESKINGEKNRIEDIKNNLSRYIESYKTHKESFEEIEILKAFTYELTPVLNNLKEGEIKEDEKQKLLSKLSYIRSVCEKEHCNKLSEKLQLEEFIEELKRELTRVFYEEYSLNYYNFEAKEQALEENLEELQGKQKSKELMRNQFIKERFIQEAADKYSDILYKESHLAEVRERISNYEKEDSEIAQNIKNYKFSLKGIYTKELQELKNKEEYLLTVEGSINDSLKENEAKQNDVALKQRENLIALTKAETIVKNFETFEEDFRKKYSEFKVVRNLLLNEYNFEELESFNEVIESNIENNLKLQKKLKEESDTLKAEKECLRKISEDINRELKLIRETLGEKKNDLSNFNKETSKIIEILRIKDFPLRVYEEKERLEAKIKSENIKLEETLSKEQKKLREIEDTIHRYETGLIQLPKEVLESFENKGISFEYGLNFLQKYSGSKEEKEALIRENPFFPYGILLSDKDITLLKSESIDVFTSIPIPIINKSDLAKSLKLEKNYDILTIENAEFLLSFNKLLIDEEERLQILNSLKKDSAHLKEEANNIKSAIERNTTYLIALANYSYAGNENEALEEEIRSVEQEIESYELQLKNNIEAIENNEARSLEILRELSEGDKNLSYLQEQKAKFKEFREKYSEFKNSNSELLKLKKNLENLKKEEEILKSQQAEHHLSLKNLAVELSDLKKTLQETLAKLQLYKNVEEGTLIQEDKNILEGKLKSCEEKLGADINRDKQIEQNLVNDIGRENSRLNAIIKEGNLGNEYMKITFSEHKLEEIKEKIKALEKELITLNSDINKLDKEIDRVIGKKQVELRDINKLGFDSPISKESIGDTNFRAREKRIKEDLKENDLIIKQYIEIIEKLKFLNQKLEFYKASYLQEEQAVFDFNNIEAAIKIIDEHIASYKTFTRDLEILEAQISKEISKIYESYRDKNRLIKERIFSFLNKEKKISACAELEVLLETIERKVSTLELEIHHIKAEEEMVINDILRYANHILSDLRTIDKKSSIKHLGKTERLLQIGIPEEKEEETLKEYIKSRVNFYSSLDEYNNLLDSDIQSSELLSKLIGNLNRVRVDIKKIEKTGLTKKSWKDVLSQNSGGEKFVSMFILLSSLMSYMRKRETDIDNKEEKKIIIMDNPFAKTNAEHLLEPMFQIAEKYNIQLLCFSGIGGSSVYNRFDKIYVAKVVGDKFRNKENVSFKAGTEETLELTDFTIGREQMALF